MWTAARISSNGSGSTRNWPDRLNRLFHIRINPYYLSLIRYPGDPIWLQCIPDAKELEEDGLPEDPLAEDSHSPVPSIVHRYPDRVLFLTTSQCSMYCRFCTRKRKVGDSTKINMKYIQDGIDYIAAHPEVRDVILSGGDPLMLTDFMLERIICRPAGRSRTSRSSGSARRCRACSRSGSPRNWSRCCGSTIRSTSTRTSTIRGNAPPRPKRACEMLADAGIPVGNQAVLMKGVNDDPDVMLELMRKLLTMRVRPYYLYQADITKGANHFRTPVSVGLDIMDKLRGHTSGLAIPHFVIDAPGGGGKIPLLPQYVLGTEREPDHPAELQVRHLHVSGRRRGSQDPDAHGGAPLHAEEETSGAYLRSRRSRRIGKTGS